MYQIDLDNHNSSEEYTSQDIAKINSENKIRDGWLLPWAARETIVVYKYNQVQGT